MGKRKLVRSFHFQFPQFFFNANLVKPSLFEQGYQMHLENQL